jgi:hypothetical protein
MPLACISGDDGTYLEATEASHRFASSLSQCLEQNTCQSHSTLLHDAPLAIRHGRGERVPSVNRRDRNSARGYEKRQVRCFLHGEADIEQVLREKKSFTLRCMLDGIKELQGRVVTWNRFASSVSIPSA